VTKLSEHFELEELLRSETAARFGIDMTPPPPVLRNLERLAKLILEPIRHRALRPIVVTSGYRPRALNSLVNGSPNSDHLTGCAADIHAMGISMDELGRVIQSVAPEIPLKKAIREFPPAGWWHVSVQPEGQVAQREFLTAKHVDGKTVYTTGVHA
jgi:zinc D-Ala-D-Ala carboxypeptidase